MLKEKSEHIDEDKTFSFSLVPAFKKLNDDQKYWAKMEVLGIMRKPKIWCFSHSTHNVLLQQLLYHRHMTIISNPKTHQQCQIFQTTEL
jgi:hypothetical protein